MHVPLARYTYNRYCPPARTIQSQQPMAMIILVIGSQAVDLSTLRLEFIFQNKVFFR
jgi:hypothetical protein